MRSVLERSVLALVDTADQPETPYYLIAELPYFGRAGFAVTSASFGRDAVVGYRDGSVVVILPPGSAFLVQRELVYRLSQEERLRLQYTDHRAMTKFVEELDPEAREHKISGFESPSGGTYL